MKLTGGSLGLLWVPAMAVKLGGMASVVTEGDSLSPSELVFQIKISISQVCVIVWEFRVIYSMLFIWA